MRYTPYLVIDVRVVFAPIHLHDGYNIIIQVGTITQITLAQFTTLLYYNSINYRHHFQSSLISKPNKIYNTRYMIIETIILSPIDIPNNRTKSSGKMNTFFHNTSLTSTEIFRFSKYKNCLTHHKMRTDSKQYE